MKPTWIDCFESLGYQQGEDEEALWARGRMPEPSRFAGQLYRAPIMRPVLLSEPFLFDGAVTALEPIKVLLFEKIRIKYGTTHTAFEAWQCCRDKKVYL